MKSELENREPLLNIKDVLLRLIYETNYTEKLTNIGSIMMKYLAEKLDGVGLLYLRDNDQDPFQFNACSETALLSYFNSVTLSPAEIKSIEPKAGLHALQTIDCFNGKFNSLKGNVYYTLMLYKEECIGVVVLSSPIPIQSFLKEELLDLLEEFTKLLYQVRRHLHTTKMGKQYEQLFLVTDKFHSSMDEKEVLEGVIHSLKELYPAATIDLLFLEGRSRETVLDSDASYVFMTGEVRKVQGSYDQDIFYVPLRGRQGIYGVLEVSVTHQHSLYRKDIEFIQLLANTAGHALENARLYQQSQRLISDLRLVNEAAQHLNASSGFNQTAHYLIERLLKAFRSDEVGVLFSNNENDWETVPGSTAFFFEEGSRRIVDNIRHKVLQTEDSLFRGDLWKEFSSKHILFRSLIAIPMFQDQHIMGLVIMLHKEPYHFTFDGFKLVISLVQHSTLALINARLKEELEYRVITDQLTHLYSRHFLNEKISESFKNGEGGVLILIDIDNFKDINDTYGHPVGDKILKQVGRIIQTTVREKDIAARWGGEELAIYLPKESLEMSTEMAEKLLVLVEQETDPQVTISCGLAMWTQDNQTGPEELLDIADKALYKAKSRGKNCIHYFI
ncbi:diguanylate cyclase (GGDEF)-like protein [Pullulanibacillus pueri]|uniref:GGDEF domain-containing protein n=1 Tax=Pullulanibacillus pueri TaxID=1437324 RepID=A0A8J2ZZX2_9BACL|nr:diguanylate cyclase [Pullulanibacillus pueri]MBM7683966.1 diguanylate cyclase (GGDEF)-like protein [Pullulanibacillus pueri]GGH88102.1 hypothetical protein GCM10007096_39670 [Pullulanibacillus pueri]